MSRGGFESRKCVKTHLRPGLCPGPAGGAYSAPLDLARFGRRAKKEGMERVRPLGKRTEVGERKGTAREGRGKRKGRGRDMGGEDRGGKRKGKRKGKEGPK